MIQFFRKSTFFGIFLLIPYSFVLHLGYILQRKTEPSFSRDCFYQTILGQFTLSWEVRTALSCLLISLQAILIAHMSNRYKLMPDGQLFSAIVFILLTGIHSDLLHWGPILIGNTFYILALYYILDLYNKKNVTVQLFNFGLCIGLASLFYIPYYIVFFTGISAVIILRGYNLKVILQMLLGFLNVWVLWYFWLIVKNDVPMFHQQQLFAYFEPYIFSMDIAEKGWIAFGIVMSLTLISIFYSQTFKIKKGILLQKQYSTIFYIMLISLFSIVFQHIAHIQHLLIWITPLSFLIGALLQRIKNSLVLETLHLGFAFLALLLQIQNL